VLQNKTVSLPVYLNYFVFYAKLQRVVLVEYGASHLIQPQRQSSCPQNRLLLTVSNTFLWNRQNLYFGSKKGNLQRHHNQDRTVRGPYKIWAYLQNPENNPALALLDFGGWICMGSFSSAYSVSKEAEQDSPCILFLTSWWS